VTQSFLDGIARQVPGLNVSKWQADLSSDSSLTAQVQSDENAASAADLTQTPAVVVKGPKGQVPLPQGVPEWSTLQAAINKVS